MVDSVYDLQVPLMPFLLYTISAAAMLWLAHRFVRRLSRWAMVILFLLPMVFAGYALVTSRVIAPVDLAYQTAPLSWMAADYGIKPVSPGFHSDVYTEFVPWREAVRWSLAHGEWGLRDPFALSGDILLAAQQAAVYWPITLISLLMPAALSFTYTAAMTLFVAGLCAFLLVRELGCDEVPALIGAAGWAFATGMLSFLLVAMSATWAWCPLLLVAVRRVVREHTFGLLIFAFTALLYSGHPESTVLAILLGILYAAFELACTRTLVLRTIALAFAAAAAALLLSAIHLLPFLEAMPQSAEHGHRLATGAPQVATGSEVFARVITSFIPYLHGRKWAGGFFWYESGAIGSVLLALAIYAFARVRSATTWFFAALAVFSLLGHAKWPLLVAVMQKIPVLSITLTDRLSYGFALSLCVLAAIGLQHITRSAALVLLIVLIILGGASWWAVHTPDVAHDARRHGDFAIAAELIGLAMATAVAAWSSRWTPALLLGIVIAQRAAAEHGIHRSFEPRQAYPPIPILEPLKNAQRPFRITGHGNALLPQTATMYGLEDVRGFPALTFTRYAETFPLWCKPQPVFYNRVDVLTRPFLSFLNVRYAITWDREPPTPGWREVARQKGSVLLENVNALDRAFVPPLVRFGPLAEMLNETDFGQRAWIEADIPPGERPNGPGRVTIREAHLGYDIDADMEGEGWIVTSITAWKGWRAYVDGRRVKTQFANHAFLGVYVPRGRHSVELRYWPESFVWGRTITVWTAAALAAALVARRIKSGS